MSKDLNKAMQSVAVENNRIILEVTDLNVHPYGRMIDGVYTQSVDHNMVDFTFEGKQYSKPCFKGNTSEGFYSKAKIEVTETNDEYVFSIRRVIIDNNLLTKAEVATRCQVVALDW